MLEELTIALLVLTKCYKVVFVKKLATHNSIQMLVIFALLVTLIALFVMDLAPITVQHALGIVSYKIMNVVLHVVDRNF